MRFFTFVLKNLLRRRVRTTLTMMGMAVAMCMAVALMGMADSFKRSFLELYEGRSVALMVIDGAAMNPMTGNLPDKLGAEITAIEGVTSCCPGLVDMVSINDDSSKMVNVQGWPAGNYMFDELKLLKGDRLNASHKGKKSVMIGRDLAANSKLGVGNELELSGCTCRIVGEFETYSGIENSMIVMLLDDLQEIQGKKGKITGCTVRLADNSDANIARVRAVIEGEVAQRLGLARENGKSKLRAIPPGDYIRNSMHVKLVTGFTWAVSVVAILMGSIVMLNTMIMSVFERTREIGILRAIGWRPSRIMRMILMESVLLCIGGGIVGTLGGMGLIWGLSRLPIVSGAIQSALSPVIILEGFAFAVLIGLIGAAYPAYRGASLLPTEAIRHE